MFVGDIVEDVMVLGKDIMNTYGFVVDLLENVQRVGHVKLSVVKMREFANHSIKQVVLAEKEVKRCAQKEPFLLKVEERVEKELVEELPMCKTTKEVNEKPTKGVEERFFLVPDLMEAPGGKVANG